MTVPFDNTHTESERLGAVESSITPEDAATIWSTIKSVGLCAAVVSAMVTSVLWFAIGRPIINQLWEEDAVRHAAAHYDPKNAQFTWNQP